MAKTDTLNIRIEPESKQDIKKTLFSDEMIEAIKEAEDMIKNHEKYKSYSNIDELTENLNKDE